MEKEKLFLDSIGKYLEFDTVIRMKMYFNEGIFDSNKELEVASGESKLRKIQEKFEAIDWNESLVYADSYYSDILASILVLNLHIKTDIFW